MGASGVVLTALNVRSTAVLTACAALTAAHATRAGLATTVPHMTARAMARGGMASAAARRASKVMTAATLTAAVIALLSMTNACALRASRTLIAAARAVRRAPTRRRRMLARLSAEATGCATMAHAFARPTGMWSRLREHAWLASSAKQPFVAARAQNSA